MNKDEQKLWGGRFNQPTDAFVEEFTSSVGFDQRFFQQDILASKAHARMLAKTGVISQQDVDAIVKGLATVEQEILKGEFQWSVSREDVHMNIEARLTELIGDAGKRLHTGRSRNDQVATDMRLYLRDEIDAIVKELHRLLTGIIELADQHCETIMPGFTHLQIAQPIVFAHHLMAWYEMLLRDYQRLRDCRRRMNVLPLGSAALAGTSYPIDREFVARELGFDSVSANSLDAVSDRDFAIEFSSAAAMIMMHLSRQSEELVLWSSTQFNFIALPDRFCTGSSIMPQKKNPDVPELVRGKTGRAYGNLMSLLTLMKSQPLAYNKDNQEDKEPLFDSIDTLKGSLRAFADMIPNIIAKKDNMLAAARKGFSTATDIADYLVKKGLPFRDAHEVVGKIVAACESKNKELDQMSLVELKAFSTIIEVDLMQVVTPQGSVAQRNHIGGTAPEQVKNAIAKARKVLLDF